MSNAKDDSKAENSHVDVEDTSSVVVVVVIGSGAGAAVLLTTFITLKSLLVVAGALAGLRLDDAIVGSLVEELAELGNVSGGGNVGSTLNVLERRKLDTADIVSKTWG